MKFSYTQIPTLSRSMDFRGAQRTSRSTAEICPCITVVLKRLPYWTWIGQEALPNQFRRVASEPFLYHSWGEALRSSLHCMQVLAPFRNTAIHLYAGFCTIVSFPIFQLVPGEEKPESSLSTFFCCCCFQRKSDILLLSHAFIFHSTQQPVIA